MNEKNGTVSIRVCVLDVQAIIRDTLKGNGRLNYTRNLSNLNRQVLLLFC